MPTHIDQLNKLSSPIWEQAIANMKAHYGSLFAYSCHYPADTLAEALALSFPYEGTPEGKAHWKAIEKRAENGEFEPTKNQQ